MLRPSEILVHCDTQIFQRSGGGHHCVSKRQSDVRALKLHLPGAENDVLSLGCVQFQAMCSVTSLESYQIELETQRESELIVRGM